MTTRFVISLACLFFTCRLALAAAGDETPVRISTVSANGMPKSIVPAGADWNFGPGALQSFNGWQYAAYWDDACQVSVARRQLPDGPWALISLPGYKRTASIDRGKGGAVSRGFGDGHEKISLGISPDGYIHLAFDHHVSTLHYRRSRVPIANSPTNYVWQADLFGPVQANLGGPNIESVTYPSFSSDGARFYMYMRLNGGSGSADSHLFQYANGRWLINTPPQSKFIDKNWSGGDFTVSAYPFGMREQNGRMHLAWCWRDTPNASTCHDLCYAYSDDFGRTWKNNFGQVIGVAGLKFITADSPGVVAVKIPPGKKYINGGSMAVDETGCVHVLVRGENGLPVHFQRDPKTAQWTQNAANQMGSLISGGKNKLYVLNEGGLYQTAVGRSGHFENMRRGEPELFEDSRAAVDQRRTDGWISAIGQTGKKISVVDYWIDN